VPSSSKTGSNKPLEVENNDTPFLKELTAFGNFYFIQQNRNIVLMNQIKNFEESYLISSNLTP
jgi:hypothetical protein